MAPCIKRQCEACGKEFWAESTNHRRSCGYACSRVLAAKTRVDKGSKKKAAPTPTPKPAVKTTQKWSRIAVVNAAARREHMTYGQYVAAKEEETRRETAKR